MIERVRDTKHAHAVDGARVVSLKPALDAELFEAIRVAEPLFESQHAIADPVDVRAPAPGKNYRGWLGIAGGLAKFMQGYQGFFGRLVSRCLDVKVEPYSLQPCYIVFIAIGCGVAVLDRTRLLLHREAKVDILDRCWPVFCPVDVRHEVDKRAERPAAHAMSILYQCPM